MAEKEYIERESVVELFNKWADGYSYIEVPTKDAIARVRAIPDADVRPVVRGEWEWEMYQYTPYCSICGGAGFPGPANGKRYNFCPHCGADMRGEDDA